MHTIYHSSNISWYVIARAIFMSIVLLVATAGIVRGQAAAEIKNGGTTLLLVEIGGDIGIGISNPLHKLHVEGGDINTSGGYKIDGDLVLNYDQSKSNIFLGRSAGISTTGDKNTFIGTSSGLSNVSGENNTFVGYWSGRSHSSGNDNTFVGYQAGQSNTSGTDNTFVGYRAGNSNPGNGNVFIGHRAGENETGSNKLYIDNFDTPNPLIEGDFFSNLLIINGTTEFGGNIRPGADGMHNSGSLSSRWLAVYAINGAIQTSDEREKRNIKDIEYGLREVLQLRPVSFTWKDYPDHGVKLGLIAQQVQPIIKEVVDVGDDPEQPLGLSYTNLIPVLIKAIQEQQAIIDQQQAQFDTLAATLEHLAQTRSKPNNIMAGLLGSGLCLLLVLVSVGRNKRRPIATVE